MEVGTCSTAYIMIVQTKRNSRLSSHVVEKSNGIAIALKNLSECKGDGNKDQKEGFEGRYERSGGRNR